MKTLPTLWYENEAGARWIPPPNYPTHDVYPPDGFHYQRSRFPRYLRDMVLRCFPDRSERVCEGESGWSGDLVMALVRPTFLERARAVLRYGSPGPRLSVDQAVLHAAVGCERCMNTLAHRVGLIWGYRPGSVEDRARTSCEVCRADGVREEE